MKKLTFTVLLILASSLTFMTTAQNYIIEDASGIGPKLGFYKAPDAEAGTMFIGLQSRVKSKYIGGEFSLEYRGEQEYRTSSGTVKIKQIPVTGSLMVFAPLSNNLSPYGLAGLGIYYTFYDYDGGILNPGDDAEATFGYHVGFGTDVALSENTALNIDYRYLFLDGNESLPEKEFSGNVLSVGLTFYF